MKQPRYSAMVSLVVLLLASSNCYAAQAAASDMSEPKRSYFDGCSSGGRQGLMAAQRYPNDFDGIVAGDAPLLFQARDASNIWIMQRLFREHFAGNLAFDTNGDGSFDSLKKVDILKEAVLAKCDAKDGIRDGVIEDPLQ